MTIPYWRNSSPSFLGTRFGLYTYCDCTQAKKKGAFSLSGWGVPNVEGRPEPRRCAVVKGDGSKLFLTKNLCWFSN